MWKSGEDGGGPYNLEGRHGEIVDEVVDVRTLDSILQHVKGAIPSASGPWVPAGLLLFHIQVSQPFIDGNHRVAWQLCHRIMDLAGFETAMSGKEALRFEGMNRSRHPVANDSGPDLEWERAVAADKRSAVAVEWVRSAFHPKHRAMSK